MRRIATLAAALVAAAVGCFGKPVAIVPASNAPGGEEAKASPVVAQESPTSPALEVSTAPAAEAAPTPMPVVAEDDEMKVTDIRVGDPALESALRFSVDRAGNVTVRPQSADGLRLFKVRDDQYGQTELIGGIDGTGAALPAAGTYLVAGKEKPLPFMDVPLGGDAPPTQYRTQKLERNCPAAPIPEKKLEWGGYTSPKIGTGRITVDTDYPARVTVYVHRGSGNSDDPADNFQNWIDYNQSSSPDNRALTERVRAYVPNLWDSGPSPHLAAGKYIEGRSECGVRGESWVDICHSAGCQMILRALLKQSEHYEINNRGIIAVAPVLGGSHWSIPDLTDASLAFNYEEKAAHWASVRALIQWEWRMLIPQAVRKIFLPDLLVGSQFSLYNEGARALAWNARGAGIPRVSYPWYSETFFERGRYLPRPLKPESRFVFPINGDLGSVALAQYTHVGEPSPMFNYIEAMEVELARQRQYAGSPTLARDIMDVAVCYINEATTSQQAKIVQFEQEYGEISKLEFAWRGKTDAKYRRAFGKAALPWMNTVIAMAPAVASHDPVPNESAANDGALTIAQQLGLRDGPSLLDSKSKYGKLLINRAAIDLRLPYLIGRYEQFDGRDHYNAVEGDSELWDWMNERLIARVDALREEERTYVLTNKDKREILDMVGPPNGDYEEYGEWDDSIRKHRKVTKYWLSIRSIQWTQDPLGTGQQNRVRVIGTGTMNTIVGWWNQYGDYYDYGSWDPIQRDWIVDEQFVVRGDDPRLVVK